MTTLEQSYRTCQSIAGRSRSNFYGAFLSLPKGMFREMCALYAFMRQTDDLGDAPGLDLSARRRRLQDWRTNLDRALTGDNADSEILPALADVAAKREIPAEYFHAVIDGVESDLSPRRFQTFQELEQYCYQVAGAVGLCCVRIWGYDGPEPRERAVACGTAFQLTNILRDLGEDAAQGRVYLPLEDLDAYQYPIDNLRHGVRNDAFAELMRFEVSRARVFYDQAAPLLDQLSAPGRRTLSAFMKTYGGLLDEIVRADFDVFSKRISLPRRRKFWILTSCLLRLPTGSPASHRRH